MVPQMVVIWQVHQPSEACQIERPVDAIDFAVLIRAVASVSNLFVFANRLEDLVIRVVANLQPYCVSLSTLAKTFFDHSQHVI